MSVAAETGQDAVVRIDPSVRRVLIFRLGSLGDTLVALPALRLIAAAFPNAERCMLTNVPVNSRAPAAAAVLGDSGLVHGYETYPVGTRDPRDLFRLLRRLRRLRPEVAIYLKAETNDASQRRDRIFLRGTGARRIVGLPAAQTAAMQVSDGSWEPESERLVRSLAELGKIDSQSRAAWDLQLTAAEIDRADAVLHGMPQMFFAASIGTKVQAKNWGQQNWSALMSNVARRYPGVGLVLAGAAEERDSSEHVACAWRNTPGSGPSVNVCGKLSPRESAAAFRNATAFLGHDSGPMHLAAAVGAPVVAVFAARNLPRTWFPYGTHSRVLYHTVNCAGCGLETCIDQRRKCILSITAQEVEHALVDLLTSCCGQQETTLHVA